MTKERTFIAIKPDGVQEDMFLRLLADLKKKDLNWLD